MAIALEDVIGTVLKPEEYDALPENRFRELVDGVVHMMATPSGRHEKVAHRLISELERRVPSSLEVVGVQEIYLQDLLRRNPDVVVVTATAYGDGMRSSYSPSEVELAVEVVSPGSESTDRKVKPREYAEARIPHFWRVEITPDVEVHTFRLGDENYIETGVFTPGDTVSAPGLGWAAVAVADLVPRR
ncbi:Uma2 family endonuclease [Phytoactinopolyspora mesophila]|nr:Uma2 family endonuclease [Phytoactinopolyspora mesophila]